MIGNTFNIRKQYKFCTQIPTVFICLHFQDQHHRQQAVSAQVAHLALLPQVGVAVVGRAVLAVVLQQEVPGLDLTKMLIFHLSKS